MRRARFDWDSGNLAKCQKHGVSLSEIELVLGSGPFIAPDPAHSEHEARFLAIGRNRVGRPIFVIFTLRLVDDEEHVRPVSARYMHAKEIKRYESLWKSQGPGAEDG